MPHSRTIAAAALTLASGLSLSACATQDYVDKHIATVNERGSALEARVQQVDSTAQGAAGAAQQANQRLDQLTARVDSLEQQIVRKTPRN